MRAVAYCRYSTDNQQENSIMYQINAAQEFCKKHDMELLNIYSDEAQTGTNTNRDGLQRLLNDCDKGLFDAVIIYDQSRLSRSVVDWFSLRETLSQKRIQLFSCTETLSNDILDSSSFLSEGVHAIFNQVHVLETRKKTIAGVTSKAKRAEFCGGTPPLGYDIKDGHYVINEFEAAGIRVMFNMYAQGYSYTDIVIKLDEMGIKSKRGKKIGLNAVYYLLINERYTGVFIWNRYQVKQMRKRITRRDNPNIVRIENAIPPIISKDMWRKVCDRMQSNRKASNRTHREYLLSGLIECGYCGGSYYGFASKNRSSGEETYYYTCGSKRRTRTCTAKNIRADEIEPAIYYILKDKLFNQNLIEKTADTIIAMCNQHPEQSTEIKKEIASRKRAVDNLLRAIEKGLNAEAGYERIDTLQAEIKALELRLQKAEFTAGKIDRDKLIKKLKEDAKRIDGDFISRRSVIREYISKIIITNDAVDIQFVGDYLDNTGGATQKHVILQIHCSREELLSYPASFPNIQHISK